jgi:MauM/NapG family ferredoxin protein
MPRPHNQARNTRRVVQTLFFLLFLYLFAKMIFPAESRIPLDIFLRADPLIAVSTALSLRKVTPPLLLFALPVLILTIIFGRVFCGWICPMGAVLDFSEKLFRWRRPRQQRETPDRFPRLPRLKYYLLMGLLVTALFPVGLRLDEAGNFLIGFGLSLVYLFDPIALLMRSLVLGVIAPFQRLLVLLHVDQALAYLAMTDFALEHEILRNLAAGLQNALAIRVDVPGIRPEIMLSYRLAPAALIIFGLIIALNSLTRRFWCRYICPLGALLGIISRIALVRNRVGPECIDCGLCIRYCRTSAITPDPHVYRVSECVACHECITICPKGAISYAPGLANLSAEPRLDLSRRRLLQAVGIGALSVLALKSDWGAKKNLAERLKISAAGLIRPPGALAEEEFVTACIRCGACMKICPTNGLQPALAEGGMEALGTPILVPRIGPCVQACNSCGKVCPTAAIEPFTIEEKSWLALGTAVIDRSLCIAWAQDKICSICDEVCSYDAISQKDPKMLTGLRPIVNPDKCAGCGLCERACPVAPEAAIRVYSFGDKRHLSRGERKELFETAFSQGGSKPQGADYGMGEMRD